MENFLNSDEKKHYFVQCLYDVACADGDIQVEEQLVLNNIAAGFGVNYNSKGTRLMPQQLSKHETVLFLREMYRLSTANLHIKVEEKAIIDDFCANHLVDSELKAAVEKWAVSMLEAEIELMGFIEAYGMKNRE